MITAVILGGVSIAGGSGKSLGVVLAVFILGLATFGLSLVNVPGIVISVLPGLLPIVVRRLIGRDENKDLVCARYASSILLCLVLQAVHGGALPGGGITLRA